MGQLDTLLVFFNVFAANSTHIYCVPLLQNNLFVHSNANIIISGETAVSPFCFLALLIEFLDIAQLLGASRPQTPRCFQVEIIKPGSPRNRALLLRTCLL